MRHLPFKNAFVRLFSMSGGLNTRLVLLPFIYFYVLSFMLILVSAYWLVASPGEVTKTYAQEEAFPEADINSSVTGLEEASAAMTLNADKSESCAFGDTKAEKIDAYFTKNSAPLAGQGCAFVREGQLNGIEPNFVAAIAMCESTGGRVTPQFNGINSYNAWGWAVYDSVETIRSVQGHNCDSWEHCIGRVSRGIVANSKERNLGVEPEDVVQWYNAGSVQRAGGNPEDSTWVGCVRKVMNKIAATPTLSN